MAAVLWPGNTDVHETAACGNAAGFESLTDNSEAGSAEHHAMVDASRAGSTGACTDTDAATAETECQRATSSVGTCSVARHVTNVDRPNKMADAVQSRNRGTGTDTDATGTKAKCQRPSSSVGTCSVARHVTNVDRPNKMVDAAQSRNRSAGAETSDATDTLAGHRQATGRGAIASRPARQ
jgi:hypothetical protein